MISVRKPESHSRDDSNDFGLPGVFRFRGRFWELGPIRHQSVSFGEYMLRWLTFGVFEISLAFDPARRGRRAFCSGYRLTLAALEASSCESSSALETPRDEKRRTVERGVWGVGPVGSRIFFRVRECRGLRVRVSELNVPRIRQIRSRVRASGRWRDIGVRKSALRISDLGPGRFSEIGEIRHQSVISGQIMHQWLTFFWSAARWPFIRRGREEVRSVVGRRLLVYTTRLVGAGRARL